MIKLRLHILAMMVDRLKSLIANYPTWIIILLLRKLKPYWLRLTQWFSPNIRRTSMIGLPAADYGRRLAGTGGEGCRCAFLPKHKRLSYTDSVPGSCMRETKSGNMICSMSRFKRIADPGLIPGASTNLGNFFPASSSTTPKIVGV